MEEVDKEISEMKLSLNARARVVAESYLLAVSVDIALYCPRLIRNVLVQLMECYISFTTANQTRVICNITWNVMSLRAASNISSSH